MDPDANVRERIALLRRVAAGTQSSVSFRRVRADEVQPGMRVARYRFGPYATANAVEPHRIVLDTGALISWRDAPLVWVREQA